MLKKYDFNIFKAVFFENLYLRKYNAFIVSKKKSNQKLVLKKLNFQKSLHFCWDCLHLND